ncbi:PUX10 [Scenedesmus sp. PABB004]|nr:PUX10 [Scenedesmus sp. PABB004]
MAAASDEQVARFVSTTGADADQAAFLLEATHGNFESAVQMFYAQPRGLLALPLRLLSAGVGVMAHVVHSALTLAALVGDRVLPAAFMRSARGAARAVLAAASAPPEPAAQAAEFVAAFDARYGPAHPAWVADGWRGAAAAAHGQFKFLFAYLHSPEHEDTDAFVRGVLCDPVVVAYVEQHFVAWGGDVRRGDAFGLSARLNVTTYPAVALLAFSGARTKLVVAAQGALRAQQLLGALRRAVEEHGVLLDAERLEREEREMSRRLLAEQNAEFEASLAADREREARRAEERRAAEEVAAARAAEEARARAEAEAAEARRLQAAASVAARRQRAAAALAPEPPPGTEGAATIRLRLPDGANAQRRFPPGSTVGALFDWVDSLHCFDCLAYHLVCAFPKRVYERSGAALDLAEAGLAPQGALFVQALDEDDGT